jgi:hypothetical protein
VTITAATSGTLGQFNVGLAVAAGLLVPLSAQIDALISIGLGPFQAELSLQLSASLAANATLSLQIGDPLIALQLAIGALAQLQAALAAALALPPINLSLSAELSAQVALAAALGARLGLLSAAIQIAVQLKLAALEAAADLQASVSAGPVAAATFSGEDFATNGAKIAALMAGGTVDGQSLGIAGSDPVSYGVILIAGSASVGASLSAIITV